MYRFPKLRSIWNRLGGSSGDQVGSISIVLLQKRLERFTSEQLSVTMQRGWRRQHDPVTFFATSVADGEGAVIKVNKMVVTVQHFDRKIDGHKLGNQELQAWAVHSAYSAIEYGCPGGIPTGEIRDQFYGFLGLLCAELLTDNTPAILFAEEHMLLRNSHSLIQQLRSGNKINPARLAALLDTSDS